MPPPGLHNGSGPMPGTGPGTVRDNAEYITKAELAELRKRDQQDTLRELLSCMHTESEKVNTALIGKLSGIMSSSNDKLADRIDGHEERLDELEAKNHELEATARTAAAEVVQLNSRVEAMERRLGVAETGHVQTVIDNDVFDRAIDPTFLWIEGEGGKVYEKKACEKAIEQWMVDAKIAPDQFKMPGKPVAKKFKLQFTGVEGLAAQLAARAVRHFKVDDEWRHMGANLEGGGSLKLYVNTNKSPKQRRTEIATRYLSRLINAEAGVRTFPNKRDGMVSFNFCTLARIEVASQDADPVIWWNAKGIHKQAANIKVDRTTKDDIKAKLLGKTTREGESFEWDI